MGFFWSSQVLGSNLSSVSRVWVLLNLTPSVLQEFANATLRTLCLCYKDISPDEFAAWSRRHKDAQVALSNRDEALDQVYEEIEKNLLVGEAEAKR